MQTLGHFLLLWDGVLVLSKIGGGSGSLSRGHNVSGVKDLHEVQGLQQPLNLLFVGTQL